MAKAKGRPASRCTILIDKVLYAEGKKRALDKSMKMYQYINFLLAKATGKEFPKYLKHPPSKEKVRKNLSLKAKVLALITPVVNKESTL